MSVKYSQYQQPSLPSLAQRCMLPVVQPVAVTSVRHVGFYNKLPAHKLWASSSGTSNAGKKKGRSRGRKQRIKNLNRGQIMGVGKVNMVWPGLNAPVVEGQTVMKIARLPDKEKEESAQQKVSIKRRKLNPLERGWSGVKMGGRSIGPPDPVGDQTFEGFDTIVLEAKQVCTMTGNLGRRRNFSVFVVTGNGKGCVGFGLAKSQVASAAISRAKKRAAQQLFYMDRYKEHTVLHDFNTEFGLSRMTVQKKPPGHGLVCHRAIASICKVCGIKDIYVKVFRVPKNYQNVTKAFFLGLLRQQRYEDLAAEKGLHLVEVSKDRLDLPVVLASPPTLRKAHEVDATESRDMTVHVLKGKLPLLKTREPPVKFHPGWEWHLRKQQHKRIIAPKQYQLTKEYGFVRSHLWDKFPECHRVQWQDPSKIQKADDDDDGY